MTKPDLWFQVEQEIANLLLDRLKYMQLTPERAVQIAKFVVKAIPSHMSDQQILDIIPRLDDQFIELASIVHKHLEEYEKTHKPIIKRQIEELMKQGHFQKASDFMKKYFENKL